MVTIDPNKSIPHITELKKAHEQTKSQPGEFDAIFRQTVDAEKQKCAQPEATSFISEIRPARFVAATEAIPTTAKIVDQVDQLIRTMEAYQQKLVDNGATLKDIQPLMEKMASHNQKLAAISEAMGEPDDLKTIINQSLTLSSMEIAKFNNGAYNDG